MQAYCVFWSDAGTTLVVCVAAVCLAISVSSGTQPRYALHNALYALTTFVCLVTWMLRGAGVWQYGAVAEMAAGLAIFGAVLCAWGARWVACASLVLIVVMAGMGLRDVWRGAAPMAGLLNVNHFGCFIAVALPLVLGMTLHAGQRRGWRAVLGLMCVLLLFLLVASKCRTALAVCTLSVLGMWGVYAGRRWRRFGLACAAPAHAGRTAGRWRAVVVGVLVVVVLAGSAAAIGLSSASADKSLSAAGRMLIWRLAARIAWAHGPNGLGFGNFGRVCNLYQADFFSERCQPVPLRMAAGQIGHAFSEPLELWAELGVWGAVMVAVLGTVMIYEAGALIAQYARAKDDTDSGAPFIAYRGDAIALGMACAVLSFMLLSLVHFPRKIMPTFALFNVALAWVVRVNGTSRAEGCKGGHECSRWTRWLWVAFWAVMCGGACALTPHQVRRWRAVRAWERAREQAQEGALSHALVICETIQDRLVWNGTFCGFFGDVLLSLAAETNSPAPGSIERAIGLYERAKYTNPYPYMFENLALAYLQLAEGTAFPVRVQTRYRMETPAQTLARTLREWRCGTNLFFELPPDELSQSECIGRAVDYLTLASHILPWRLTSRWYLAQVYRDVGEYGNAVKYARLVVNIPMKKDTPRAREIKVNAQKLLNELGVQCDDPGLVVFDIRDRRTWNEGRW